MQARARSVSLSQGACGKEQVMDPIWGAARILRAGAGISRGRRLREARSSPLRPGRSGPRPSQAGSRRDRGESRECRESHTISRRVPAPNPAPRRRRRTESPAIAVAIEARRAGDLPAAMLPPDQLRIKVQLPSILGASPRFASPGLRVNREGPAIACGSLPVSSVRPSTDSRRTERLGCRRCRCVCPHSSGSLQWIVCCWRTASGFMLMSLAGS